MKPKDTYYRKHKDAILKARKEYYYNNRERILENNRRLKEKREEVLNKQWLEFQKQTFKIQNYEDGINPFHKK